MDASPRGPNQPINTTLAGLRRVPMSAIATGSIRTAVRLRTAYSADARLNSGQASVHKDLRLCDLCKELAFGTQRADRKNGSSYNSFAFSMLCRQFLERTSPREEILALTPRPEPIETEPLPPLIVQENASCRTPAP